MIPINRLLRGTQWLDIWNELEWRLLPIIDYRLSLDGYSYIMRVEVSEQTKITIRQYLSLKKL